MHTAKFSGGHKHKKVIKITGNMQHSMLASKVNIKTTEQQLANTQGLLKYLPPPYL